MNNNLRAALAFLDKEPRSRLFPARWNGAHSGLVKWGENSSGDIDTIKEWANKWPDAYFCVDLRNGKSPVRVIDIDVKGDKDGLAEFLKVVPKPPSTTRAKTPSGGWHLFYTAEDCPNIIGNKDTSPLGRGVDLPVMVPVPGSTVPGKGTYSLVANGQIAALPQWITDKVKAAKTVEARTTESDIDLDLPHNIDRATNYLVTQAPEAIEGNGGDQVTFTVAARLRDLGVSETMALELMSEHWNELKASPPWTITDLQKKIRNAYSYGENSPGCDTPEAMFPTAKLGTGLIRNASEIEPSSIKPRPWLLGHRYLPHYVTATVAPGGVGKSVLTIMESLSVATMRQLTYDAPRIKGNVWIYNLEDPFDELERRIMATAKHHEIPTDELNGVYYTSGYDQPMILVSDNGKGQLTVNEQMVSLLIEHIMKRDIKLFTVDPFVRCHRVNENDNMAIDKVVQVFQRIAKETGCAISLVHHTSKGKDHAGKMDAARGASAFMSAARIAHTLVTMSEKEAKEYGIPQTKRKWYVKLDDAKANLAPPSDLTRWFERQSVKLMFDSDETTGTLSKIPLEKVQKITEDDTILDYVSRNIEDGDTVYDAAKVICETTGSKPITVRRRILKLFSDGKVVLGLKSFSLGEGLDSRNKPAKVFKVVEKGENHENSEC